MVTLFDCETYMSSYGCSCFSKNLEFMNILSFISQKIIIAVINPFSGSAICK
jgi:hypothetical protein